MRSLPQKSSYSGARLLTSVRETEEAREVRFKVREKHMQTYVIPKGQLSA